MIKRNFNEDDRNINIYIGTYQKSKTYEQIKNEVIDNIKYFIAKQTLDFDEHDRKIAEEICFMIERWRWDD